MSPVLLKIFDVKVLSGLFGRGRLSKTLPDVSSEARAAYASLADVHHPSPFAALLKMAAARAAETSSGVLDRRPRHKARRKFLHQMTWAVKAYDF